MRGFNALYRSLNRDPRQREFQFEHVCRWFLANDPTYKALLTKVWS
jgi:hypothetical protein